jgi:hypothetical protein
MGPKLFDLPILLALAYVGMGYLSWVLAVVILDCQNEPLSGRKIVLLPLAASLVMTAWDFSMDAVWADVDHAWMWRDGGSYYGVPTSNFFGWFLTVYIFYQPIRVASQRPKDCPISNESLASRDLILCHIRSGESFGCGSLVYGRDLRGWCRQTLAHPRHSLVISPRFNLSHDASQPDRLAQSFRTGRLLETNSSEYSERVTQR